MLRDKPKSGSSAGLPLAPVIAVGLGWFVLALMFFLLFGTPSVPEVDPATEQLILTPETGKATLGFPLWYTVGTYIFELAALFAASLLCFRNYQSPQVVSGRSVWLCFALGLLLYFLGDLVFGYYEVVLRSEQSVSIADFFYFGTYALLGVGMILAIASRRLTLDLWQWVLVAVVGLLGALFALWVNHAAAMANPSAPLLDRLVTAAYPLFDTALLIITTILLLAFWGGRFAQAWRLIAGGVLALYVADSYYQYASNAFKDYQSGSLTEVFFVLFPVLFAIGAAVEYELSNKSRRGIRRR
ncbi:hypothetical protein [Leptolyngbya sp. FACHB-261]|uniref:hypothetical protein n=1 Tax=Leptolyngbya sp. FACHB-261 TaxID=2692806 RepID=UPI00168504AC|nr:hypothetical protein [Leptolyngbya sp. FACHB-261]MBD2099814.1 hypothetical protein [Leptolyngbya sp. FACHB-261]